MDEKTKQELLKLNQEKNELNRLINQGIQFTVEADVVETSRRLLFFKTQRIVKKTMQFCISEPTLGTLDRISSISVDFDITDAKLKQVDDINKGMTIASQNARKCAKIIAYAVIGSEFEVAETGKDGRVHYHKDTERLNYLTDLFMRTVKPSQLYQLVTLIDLMCNLGDFTNSIRLLASDRTTMPNRIDTEA